MQVALETGTTLTCEKVLLCNEMFIAAHPDLPHRLTPTYFAPSGSDSTKTMVFGKMVDVKTTSFKCLGCIRSEKKPCLYGVQELAMDHIKLVLHCHIETGESEHLEKHSGKRCYLCPIVSASVVFTSSGLQNARSGFNNAPLKACVLRLSPVPTFPPLVFLPVSII